MNECLLILLSRARFLAQEDNKKYESSYMDQEFQHFYVLNLYGEEQI